MPACTALHCQTACLPTCLPALHCTVRLPARPRAWLVPTQVPLASALPFLEGALWGAGERRRTAAVARNLRRSEHVGLLGELADARQRWVGAGAAEACPLLPLLRPSATSGAGFW